MENSPRSVADLNVSELRPPGTGFPSPENWLDQSLYFLLVDRFSNEDQTISLAKPEDRGNAVRNEEDAKRWREAGSGYVGGNLKGIARRLDYLVGLGITALWISPILKQSPWSSSYHGYATQDFLSVEPRLGTAEDLRDLVAAAHQKGLRVILDIVVNHAANVFSYEEGGTWSGEARPVQGWNDRTGSPTIPFETGATDDRDAAVWPIELQNPEAFHRKGSIADWDNDPEYREGDFFDLKDFDHGQGGLDDYVPSPALIALTEAYRYWIAYADLDGFRIDTVKHVDPGALKYFSTSIRSFAETLGKCDFFLIGEVTGGRGFALDLASKTGLDAALEISGEPSLVAHTAKGDVLPEELFDLYPDGKLPDQALTVSILDDHDQVCRGRKARFASDPIGAKLLLPAFALNVLTLGIPCIYYGSEQGFDGHGDGDDAERYIRESMFGGEFGAFGSRGVHFFDEASPTYKELAALLNARSKEPCLRRGQQFLRETSADGENFGLPSHQGDAPIRGIVAWSRILDGREVLVAINVDPENESSAWVTIDSNLRQPGEEMTCLHASAGYETQTLPIESRNGLAVWITLPPAGVALFA